MFRLQTNEERVNNALKSNFRRAIRASTDFTRFYLGCSRPPAESLNCMLFLSFSSNMSQRRVFCIIQHISSRLHFMHEWGRGNWNLVVGAPGRSGIGGSPRGAHCAPVSLVCIEAVLMWSAGDRCQSGDKCSYAWCEMLWICHHGNKWRRFQVHPASAQDRTTWPDDFRWKGR
jgi:hypothetical protein